MLTGKPNGNGYFTHKIQSREGGGIIPPINKRRQPMFKLIKRLLKKSERSTVYKNGKKYKFKTFEKATAFMMLG